MQNFLNQTISPLPGPKASRGAVLWALATPGGQGGVGRVLVAEGARWVGASGRRSSLTIGECCGVSTPAARDFLRCERTVLQVSTWSGRLLAA
jgi:hypothetical protein